MWQSQMNNLKQKRIFWSELIFNVQVIWSRTGCKPDLELSFRHYCLGAAAILQCPLLAADCRRLGPAASLPSLARQRTPQQFKMLEIRIKGLFLLCCCNDVCCEVSSRFRTNMDFSLEVYQNGSLVLTTTSCRSWIPIMVMLMIGINESLIQTWQFFLKLG